MAVEVACTVNDWTLLIRSSLALQVYYIQGMFPHLHVISFLNPKLLKC